MQPSERWALAVALVLLDLVVILVPVIALVAAWLLIARPPRFREWVDRLYEGG